MSKVELNEDDMKSIRAAGGSLDVGWLQKWLREKCGASLTVDGVGGSVTRAAFIAAFAYKYAEKIAESELKNCANMLGDTETARIKAIAEVESRGSGWLQSGLPVILWERHKFWGFTSLKNRVKSWFANPARGGYSTDENQNGINDSWEKLSYAACKDPLSALKSISIGKFQIMGFHYESLGFDHPIEMLFAASRSESAQYEMLVRFILDVAKCRPAFLKICEDADKCRDFAKAYNGAAYEDFSYHKKIAAAYRKFQ